LGACTAADTVAVVSPVGLRLYAIAIGPPSRVDYELDGEHDDTD
jgi:hypothetical protein